MIKNSKNKSDEWMCYRCSIFYNIIKCRNTKPLRKCCKDTIAAFWLMQVNQTTEFISSIYNLFFFVSQGNYSERGLLQIDG